MFLPASSNNLDVWIARLDTFRQNAKSLLPAAQEQLDEILHEFQTTLEELRTADEELRQQHEALLVANESIILERQRYQDLFNLAPDAYVVSNLLGLIQQANTAAMVLLRRDAIHIVGKPLASFIALEERLRFRQLLLQAADEQRVIRLESQLRIKGDVIFVHLTVNAIHETDTGEVKLLWFVRDITDQRQAEIDLQAAQLELEERVQQRTAELSQANAFLGMMIEGAKDYAIFSLDLEGRVTSWNDGAERLFGYSEAEIMGQIGAIVFVPEDRAAGVPEQELITAHETGSASDERWKQRKDGSRFFASGMTRPMLDADGRIRGYVKVARDVTERMQAEEISRLAHERALALSALEERQRLARDLHDVVSQTLYSAAIVAESLPRLWTDLPAPLEEQLLELNSLTRSAAAEMRMLLLELHPATLLKSDLEELLHQLVLAAQARKRINASVKVDGQPQLPEPVHIVFYRIAQEAFNNIIKHAQATDVTVELTSSGSQVALRIEDNGRGFDSANPSKGGLGLDVMRERAADIDANLDIESTVGRGTTVRLVWSPPLESASTYPA